MPEKTQEKKEVNIVKEETKELIMTLKSYNEIFSDFDSRPYNQRILSDDFIEELNREYRDMPSEKIRLKLLIPENQRNQEEETIIKKRINDYFKQRYIANYKTYKNKIKSGIWLIIIGIILTAIYIFLITKIEILKISFLETIISVGVWFCFWEGAYLILFDTNNEKPILDFCKAMANAKISFESTTK